MIGVSKLEAYDVGWTAGRHSVTRKTRSRNPFQTKKAKEAWRLGYEHGKANERDSCPYREYCEE